MKRNIEFWASLIGAVVFASRGAYTNRLLVAASTVIPRCSIGRRRQEKTRSQI